VLRALLITVLAAGALLAHGVQARPAAAPAPPRVTFIGDSVATGILYTADAKRILERGVEVDYQLAVCRRLAGDSCPYDGTRPLTLVDLVPTIKLAPTVVVAVGYNDPADTFAQSVESALAALEQGGAQHVLWLTLRAQRQSYLDMNDVVRAASTHHPELTVVDWNLYSRSHPDWFQDDGLHLGYGGAVAMATLIHKALEDVGSVAAPVASTLAITTKKLPAAQVAKPYRAQLKSAGGTRPITWRLENGALPPGVRILPGGRLTGTPRAAGRFTPTLGATDAKGGARLRRFALVVAPR
jgi:hypothetical protein